MKRDETYEGVFGGPRLSLHPDRRSLLEVWFPSRALSELVDLDRRGRDPSYSLHRWWARRPPALMRALLLASVLPEHTTEEEFWTAYAKDEWPLRGLTVLDPFIGGGSTLIEAHRLGAHVEGGDVDPLAVRALKRALLPVDGCLVRDAGEELLSHLRKKFSVYYPREKGRVPLHYFSVAEVTCPSCQASGPLYKNLVIARDVGKHGSVVRDHAITGFCPDCYRLHHSHNSDLKTVSCCGKRRALSDGTFVDQMYRCPQCHQASSHRELQTGKAPRRLVAVEETVRGGYRELRSPTRAELDMETKSGRAWQRLKQNLPYPKKEVPAARADERPRSFGLLRYEEMFTPRQLLVFASAFKWVRDSRLSAEIKDALELSLSNSLPTNNRLCGYATDYGRLAALFTVRGYSLPSLSVELNPLAVGAGRGTIAACIERVAKASQRNVTRNIWDTEQLRVGKQLFDCSPPDDARVDVRCRDASGTSLDMTATADLAVFDPPYFNYIAYDELSEFHRVWLKIGKLGGAPLLPTDSDSSDSFGRHLGNCLTATLARLKPGRPMTFTYHSSDPRAWQAIGIALDCAELRVTSLWPVRCDGHMGHHTYPGNCEWDLVVTVRRASETKSSSVSTNLQTWLAMIEPLAVGEADLHNFRLALEIAHPRWGLLFERTKYENKCGTAANNY